MADFKKLQVWQKAHGLALDSFSVARLMKGPEYSSLRSQFTRAATSIDANIVEGRNRGSDKEFVRYLNVAIGSANELEAHLIMARDTSAIGAREYVRIRDQIVEVRRMLYGLIKRLKASASD